MGARVPISKYDIVTLFICQSAWTILADNATLHFEIKWPKMKNFYWLTAFECCIGSLPLHGMKNHFLYTNTHQIISRLSIDSICQYIYNAYIVSVQRAVFLPSVSISHALHICRCNIRRLVVLPSLAHWDAEHGKKSFRDFSLRPIARRGRRAEANKIANLFTIRIFYTFILHVEWERVISNVNT